MSQFRERVSTWSSGHRRRAGSQTALILGKNDLFLFFQIGRAGGNCVLALVGKDRLPGNAGITLLQQPTVFVQVRVAASHALGHKKPSASTPPHFMPLPAVFSEPLVGSLKFLQPHGVKPHENGHAISLHERGKTNSDVPRVQSRHRHFCRRKPFSCASSPAYITTVKPHWG